LADFLLVNKKPVEQSFSGFCASLLRIDGNFERSSNLPVSTERLASASAIFIH